MKITLNYTDLRSGLVTTTGLFYTVWKVTKLCIFSHGRTYLNLTMPSDEESGDEPIAEEFLR